MTREEAVKIVGEEYRGIKAVYYMDSELTTTTEDLGSLDWEIDHYEILD